MELGEESRKILDLWGLYGQYSGIKKNWPAMSRAPAAMSRFEDHESRGSSLPNTVDWCAALVADVHKNFTIVVQILDISL
jgi:hypothetical protein